MKPKGSLPHSQKLSTCPYPKSDPSSPYSHPTSWRSILILPSHLCLGLPSGLLPSDLPIKSLYPPLLFPIVPHALLNRFPLLTSCQRVNPNPRSYEMFRNLLRSDGKELWAPRPTPKLENHPLSTVRHCLFNIFAATSHNGRPFLHPQTDDKTNIM
jgi:hypothetical protein